MRMDTILKGERESRRMGKARAATPKEVWTGSSAEEEFP